MGNSSSAEADDNDWGYPRFQRNDRGRAMADEAPLTLRNRAAQPERGYQPEPSIDAALGGAFNTSGKSNLPAEEVNEVTDTEDEDQELTPMIWCLVCAKLIQTNFLCPNQLDGLACASRDVRTAVRASILTCQLLDGGDTQEQVPAGCLCASSAAPPYTPTQDGWHYAIITDVYGVKKQTRYADAASADKAWSKCGYSLTHVYFKLKLVHDGRILLYYNIEKTYGFAKATRGIEDAFVADNTVGLDTTESDVKWSVGKRVAVVAVTAAVCGVAITAAGKALGVIDWSNKPKLSPEEPMKEWKAGDFRWKKKFRKHFSAPGDKEADHIVDCRFASWAANKWQKKNRRELPPEAQQFLKDNLINSKRNGELLEKSVHLPKTTNVGAFFRNKEPLKENYRASMLGVCGKFEKMTKREVGRGTLDSKNAKIVTEVLGIGKEKIGQ